ncbi:hypothetical protein MUK42_09409 [Musa troglodytarum]|uniref:TFIIS N-terminal domain-containing protein n=1 Tax=Musa troglodytarum TaxID=320322 RepID=A0A9E7EFV4_9LILI|nr:hypothetical protein MUK42_09409 [Musa troglodytarum]URD76161.1 hypothetical protein MUK42_09409 [Musa troglodytarum]URD76162.1 hypothetical protein MUK42_09409 [Musa troglodytarum]URD76163.1 hypothetical protein MUK42_09409 [Musa troglodytarum]
MTLEDFFTLTEMRDGLSSLGRVEELLSMIQKLNDCVTGNLGDAVRQWSTVSCVLAATENKECLNQFIQLNGLSLLNHWLQKALMLSSEASGYVVEELISSSLTLFERLSIDFKRVTDSGIGIVIELLLDHKNIPIKEKARLLYDKWNLSRSDHVNCDDHNSSGASQNDQHRASENVGTSENCVNLVNPVVDIPPCSTGTVEERCEAEPSATEFQVSNVTGCSDSTLLDSTNMEGALTSNQVLSTSLNLVGSTAVLVDVNSSGSYLVSDSCQENLSVTEEFLVCAAVGEPSTRTCSQDGQERDVDGQHHASVSKVNADSVKGMDVEIRESQSCKFNPTETCSNSSSFAFSASKTPPVDAAEQTISCKLDSNNGDSCASKSVDNLPEAGTFNYEREKCVITAKSNPAANLTGGFQNISSPANFLSSAGDPQLSCQRKVAMSSVVRNPDCEVNLKTSKSHVASSTDFLRVVGTKANDKTSQKFELGFDYLDDALEVARQVAIAVQREVVDYKERSCSSPEVNFGENTGSQSPDSEEEKLDQSVTEEVGGSSSSAGKDHSGTSSPEKVSEITQNISVPENSEQDIESLKPKVPAQELVGKTITNGCTFDLNMDLCGDDLECLMKPIMKIPVNVSAPIAVIASSKGTPGFPFTPIRLGSETGWKGSAATSAFRPASPRRTPDGERTFSSSKQKSNIFEIDLNVVERVDEVADELLSVKQVPASSSMPSEDSCVKVGSRRTEKLNLDLNRLGDEDASACPSSPWKLHIQNGGRHPSPAFSSSSRQPLLRDFDLNDNPCFPDTVGSHDIHKSSSKASESCGGPTPHGPVIRIMGSRIAVERKDNTNQVQQSFPPNGLHVEHTAVANAPVPFINMPTPAYGYPGLPTGPTMSVPPVYYSPGSISYMVDTRGATVIPHVFVSGGLGVPSARPHFHFGATNTHSDVTGFGSFQSGFDLNGGMTPLEGGTGEGGGFKQLFPQGHSSWLEEQAKAGAHPKRKEADSGWDSCPIGYKKMTSRP